MTKEDAAVTITDDKDCTIVTVNINTILTNPSTVAVNSGRRVKSLTIISVIIVGVLIFATIAVLSAVLLKKNSKATKKDRSSMTFTAQKTYPTEDGGLLTSLAVVDVNNDKKPDIIVTNGFESSISVLLNFGDGTFLPQTSYSTRQDTYPIHVSVVDVNGDNKPDIIVALFTAEGVGVLINSGNGIFFPQIYYRTGRTSFPSSLAVADINHDQKPDIIVVNHNKGNVRILFNRGDGAFLTQVIYPFLFDTILTSLAVADVNGDSNPDIVCTNYFGDSVIILFNTGNGTFASSATYPTGTHSRSACVSVADVNQDDKIDIIVANSGKSNIGVLFNSGNGTFLSQRTYSTGNNSNPQCVSIVDLNGDNRPEIVVTNHNKNNVGILVNFGNGTFLLQNTYSTGYDLTPQFVSVVDVNGDDKPDIIVTNSNKSTVGVMLAAQN